MNSQSIAPLLVAGLIQVTPVARALHQVVLMPGSPVAIVLRWVISASALAGTFHAVSAATAVLASASSITGTVGTRLSYQIKINDGKNRLAESWIVAGQTYGRTGSASTGLPAGLTLSLATAIISGVPTAGGTFAVPITAYEHPNLKGGKLNFTLNFTISGGAVATEITTQPNSSLTVHVGDITTLSVAATGDSLQYQWRRDGVDLIGASGNTFTLESVTAADAGSYSVLVRGAGGSVASDTAIVTVIPLELQLSLSGNELSLSAETIVGRQYAIESADSLLGPWTTFIEPFVYGSSLLHTMTINGGDFRFWRLRVSPPP